MSKIVTPCKEWIDEQLEARFEKELDNGLRQDILNKALQAALDKVLGVEQNGKRI